MTRWVIDASVVVKWIVPDPGVEAHVDDALAVLTALRAGAIGALQPVHWLADVAGVLTRLRPAIAGHAVGLLAAMDLPVADAPEHLIRACELAIRLDHHLFDTLYHAVALEADGATLITADDRYHRKACGEGRIVRLAGWREAASPTR